MSTPGSVVFFSLLDRHYSRLAQWVTRPLATSTFALLAGGSSLGSSLTSTMERETEGAGRGGWGAGGPTEGVTTTLPLQGKILDLGIYSFVSYYLVMPMGSAEVVGGKGCRGRLTTGLTRVTPPRLMLLATPSLRMICVPGVMGVPGGGADV